MFQSLDEVLKAFIKNRIGVPDDLENILEIGPLLQNTQLGISLHKMDKLRILKGVNKSKTVFFQPLRQAFILLNSDLLQKDIKALPYLPQSIWLFRSVDRADLPYLFHNSSEKLFTVRI